MSIKFKKNHKIKINQIKQSEVTQGIFGLQALESCYITAKQLEATRKAIIKSVKKLAIYYRKMPISLGLTEKPIQVRMGKGKGAIKEWVAAVRPGKVIIEVGGKISDEKAIEILKLGAKKLPIKTRIINGF